MQYRDVVCAASLHDALYAYYMRIIPHFSARDDAHPTKQLLGPAEDFFFRGQSRVSQ